MSRKGRHIIDRQKHSTSAVESCRRLEQATCLARFLPPKGDRRPVLRVRIVESEKNSAGRAARAWVELDGMVAGDTDRKGGQDRPIPDLLS